MMDASVIVCTFNRSASLAQTLRCLAAQQVRPDLAWEVIVVDNNSADDTRSIVQAATASNPLIRYEFEAKQGLSHARNHGIEVSRGDILLFTDDDVCPEPDWVSTVLSEMERLRCDACGGYIAPIWEKTPPAWLTERFYGFLAIRMDTRGPFPITAAADAPFGANMAFRRDVFEKVGAFDTNRGRKGAELASGEDGELFERTLKAGFTVMWLPNARVHHKVEAFRVEKRYFRRWRYQTSRNLAHTRGMPGERRLLGVPLYLARQTARAAWNWLTAKFTAPADEAFHREIILFHFLGTLRGLYDNHLRETDR